MHSLLVRLEFKSIPTLQPPIMKISMPSSVSPVLYFNSSIHQFASIDSSAATGSVSAEITTVHLGLMEPVSEK
jgi:hypothetical protein